MEGTVGSYYDGSDSYTEDDYWEDWDRGRGSPKGKIEGYIATLFHDLIDGGTEEGDSTEYSGRYVAKVFATCRVNLVFKRNDVSDFVWCLENRINRSVNWRFPIVDEAANYEDEALWVTLYRAHPDECLDDCSGWW